MERTGIDFFPFPSVNSTALKLMEAKYKLRGVAIYVKLLQKIFSEEGYYYQISDDVILLLKQEMGVNDNIIPEVINECIARGLFDKEMYEKYNILTSDNIQKEYLNAVRKRKNFNIKEEYRLPFATNFLKTAEEKQKMAVENGKTAEELNKGKESKPNLSNKETSLKRSKETADEPPSLSAIENFKKQTNKYVANVTEIPLGIDMELLTKKVLESDWLMQAQNMNLKQCLKHYDEIINNNYANDKRKQSNYQQKNDAVITHHYTEEEVSNLFTDLDKLEL